MVHVIAVVRQQNLNRLAHGTVAVTSNALPPGAWHSQGNKLSINRLVHGKTALNSKVSTALFIVKQR